MWNIYMHQSYLQIISRLKNKLRSTKVYIYNDR